MCPVQTKADLKAEIDRLHAQLQEARGDMGRPPTYREMRERIRFLTEANEAVRQEAEKCRREVTRLHFNVSRLTDELDEVRKASGIRKLNHFSDGESASIPSDLLPLMIRLSHPDKHGNSESANKVTAWLLKQR